MFILTFRKCNNRSDLHLIPILSSQCGYLCDSLEESDNALLYYSKGNLVNQNAIMKSVLLHYIDLYNNDQFNEGEFLVWANDISLVVSLHAYRLLLELLYENLFSKLNKVDKYGLDRSLILGSFRYFPGTHELNNTVSRKNRSGSQKNHRHSK